jgi:hypothetical protein
LGLSYQAWMMMVMVIGECGVISGMRIGREN